MEGTSSGRRAARSSVSSETMYSRSTEGAIRVPPAPNNDASADSARGGPGPVNRSR
jgi:hypothetical protein